MVACTKQWLRPLGCALALALAGCDGPQSMFQPDGPAAAAIVDLWWVLFGVCTVVFLVVVALLGYVVTQRREPDGRPAPMPKAPSAEEQAQKKREKGVRTAEDDAPQEVVLDTAASDRTALRWIIGGAVGSAVVLIALLVITLSTLAFLHGRDEPAALTIEVTGWMWWWEVRYFGPEGRLLFETANEIHIPVDRRVRLRLEAADVIHSFWVPQLAGKMDMIPGRTNVTWIEAAEPGVYRGQCAEYCGTQHAHMIFLVVAKPQHEFEAWAERQMRDAVEPADPLAALGREVFLENACAACHAIRGTPAVGEIGPDLTHVGSRRTLAAGMLPNTEGHMGGWIANPQEIKPDADMPAVPLAPRELRALVHYMMSLE